jgi:hypothetical protein
MRWKALLVAPLLFGLSFASADTAAGSYEIVATVYPSPQVVGGGDLPKFFAEILSAKYASKDGKSGELVFYTQSLNRKAVLKGCRSRPLDITPAEGLGGSKLIAGLEGAAGCVLANKRAHAAKLTIQTVGTVAVDGRPVNLGLWAKEKGVKYDYLTAVAVGPGGAKPAPPSKWLVFALKYPIEHG